MKSLASVCHFVILSVCL